MKSIWQDSIDKTTFGSLRESVSTDVLIIGGGIAGILCAYKLRQSGIDCILVEADRICGGISENTTAKITLQHGLIYNKLGRAADKYLMAQREAMDDYERLCSNIDCDYEKRNSFVYSLNDRKKLEREVSALRSLGVDAELTDTDLPFETAGAVCVKDQAQFHPLKFLYGIARDLPIYESTKIVGIKSGRAHFNGGSISARRIIIATHFPIINKHGAYFLKMYQHRSYVLALRGAPLVDGMYVDESDAGMSFRTYGEHLLLGGGGHRTGKDGGSYHELEHFVARYYPGATITHRFATQDCMTLDSVPYVGMYSKSTENLFVVTGFNKWGMTSSMLSANILTDMLIGRKNSYADVFSPQRSILHPQLAVNAAESFLGLVTPTAPRCPHLGCALKYNRAEHSWDCPCHGSRFTSSGQLINGPATDDKKGI